MKSELRSFEAAPSVDNDTPLPLFAMARFRRLMSQQGWAVDLGRLCSDSAYMHQCLARAHACGEEQLHRVALLVFAGYSAQPTLVFMH